MKKKMIEELREISLYNIEYANTIDKFLENIKIEVGKNIKEGETLSQIEFSTPYYDSDTVIEIKIVREETDQEYKARLGLQKKKKEIEKKKKQEKLEADRLEYERLKKIFEGLDKQ